MYLESGLKIARVTLAILGDNKRIGSAVVFIVSFSDKIY